MECHNIADVKVAERRDAEDTAIAYAAILVERRRKHRGEALLVRHCDLAVSQQQHMIIAGLGRDRTSGDSADDGDGQTARLTSRT
jgi:hypothetical protein